MDRDEMSLYEPGYTSTFDQDDEAATLDAVLLVGSRRVSCLLVPRARASRSQVRT